MFLFLCSKSILNTLCFGYAVFDLIMVTTLH